MKIVGGPAVRARLGMASAALAGPATLAGLMAAGKVVEAAARANVAAKMKSGTGEFRGAIATTPAGRSVFVGSSHPGAAVQEFGAVIVPRRAKRLRFTVDGQTVFARAVTVPPRPWLRPAADQNRPRMLAEAGVVVGAVMRRTAP